MNSIGLPNKGLDGYLAHDLPELARLPVPLIVNVMGFTHAEVAQLVRAFAVRDEVSALELNVSCPNVETGTLIGSDPAEVTALLDVVRPLTDKPMIVKLTPNAADVPAVARAAQDAGADAVSLINTLRGMALAPGTGRPWLGGGTGGVSGPAVRAVALAQTAAVCAEVDDPGRSDGRGADWPRRGGPAGGRRGARGGRHGELSGSARRCSDRRRTRRARAARPHARLSHLVSAADDRPGPRSRVQQSRRTVDGDALLSVSTKSKNPLQTMTIVATRLDNAQARVEVEPNWGLLP